jgi:hypothetical protein
MSILVITLLTIIAYVLWRIYRQRKYEIIAAAGAKFYAKREQEKKERFKNYPYLFGKLEGSLLEVLARQAEVGSPLLKLSFYLMLHESTKIDFSEGSMKWDYLWNATQELLEHLEKFHKGSIVEHEIAVAYYWQIAATAVGELIKESPDKITTQSGREISSIAGEKLEVEPYTNINKIAPLFPKKANHPAKEISFYDENGKFPKKSEGSAYIREKLHLLM